MSEIYKASLIRRRRRTNAELEELDQEILRVVEADQPMTVRGVFYRMLGSGLIEKEEREYATVQRRVLHLRRSGRMPYFWIADGSRWTLRPTTFDDIEDALADTAATYRRAMWRDQPVHVEIWSEKDAISSIVNPVTNMFDVPLMIARGYASESFLWLTAQELKLRRKPAVIYQLGDHDPSGIDAWRHTQERLQAFAPEIELVFERLAVTEEQISELDLPTRPTKKTDSRARGFRGESVEVDAVPSGELRRIVEDAIGSHIDPHAWQLARMAEESERELLTAIRDDWSGVGSLVNVGVDL